MSKEKLPWECAWSLLAKQGFQVKRSLFLFFFYNIAGVCAWYKENEFSLIGASCEKLNKKNWSRSPYCVITLLCEEIKCGEIFHYNFFGLLVFLNLFLSTAIWRMLLKVGTGPRELGTAAWERVYSRNPHEKSKWVKKTSNESESTFEMKAKFFRVAPLFVVIGPLAFILILLID